eukprot:CAMPEP_0185771168 /NCGR_PEP_ID=MMETSP1174-20130828/63483_1 /TAXON_ID=35687 /ORGANISM="Dictyocha speculum, Strain CCMP1381" /LENGTH=242 /DNA_ID=CAMNT_0028456939 /DNA_START=13 /DNA_END=741 /DNA_ORIENTATION=+
MTPLRLFPLVLLQIHFWNIYSLSLPRSLSIVTSDVTPKIQWSLSRRAMLGTLGTGAVSVSQPFKINAAEPESMMNRPDSLLKYVYKILRVQEATLQEVRLINSGKFKDLQRANIKLAANMMLVNYNLDDCIVQAARYAKNGQIIQATDAGRGAVEALNQINEYFDSSDKSLQVNSISREKQDFIIKALSVTRSKLDQFLTYMPDDVVRQATEVFEEENNINVAEYASFNKESNGYLNPSPGR